jgi:hypothetical protein
MQKRYATRQRNCKLLIINTIGLQGFEPWTSPTRTARSTKLSHSPNKPTFSIILVGRMGQPLCHFQREVQA